VDIHTEGGLYANRAFTDGKYTTLDYAALKDGGALIHTGDNLSGVKGDDANFSLP